MAWETIVFEASDGVATLTLNRPDRLNSLNARMHEEIAAVLGTVESDPGIRALLLTGTGRGFCAGQDLNLPDAGAATGDFDAGAALERYYNPLIRRLRALAKPIVAAVNGPAAGAGDEQCADAEVALDGAEHRGDLLMHARIETVEPVGAVQRQRRNPLARLEDDRFPRHRRPPRCPSRGSYTRSAASRQGPRCVRTEAAAQSAC